MKTAKKAPKTKRSAAPAKPRGNMKPAEITPLIMAATDAYKIQDPGISFKEWRDEIIQAGVNRESLSACDSDQFCDLMGHFKMAAGKEEEALNWFMRAGKNPERQTAWSIAQTLAAHQALAKATEAEIAATTPARRLKRRLEARAALLDHAEGPITFENLLTIVRGKTRKPNLDLDGDLMTALVARCKLPELIQIRYTLVNRINEREGRGLTCERNKSQNSEAAKARRSPDTLAPRFE